MRIAILGEAWNAEEAERQRPFVGAVGYHLDQVLSIAGIDRSECLVTTVFKLKPKRGSVYSLCTTKAKGATTLPPLARGKYLKHEYLPHIGQLKKELAAFDPTCIIALGPTALWSLTGAAGIRAQRGYPHITPEGWLVIPTYHPGAFMRQWSLRALVIADMQKAARLAASGYTRPHREITIEPTISDLLEYERKYFASAAQLACDIETKQDQITCIGFSPDPSRCIVIPFFLHSGANYWGTKEEELKAWEIIRGWLAKYPTVYQNGLYDMGYLWRVYGIPAPKNANDTMLKHHAQQPEMEKGLGFLASLYTDEPAWKFMGKGLKHD